MGQTLEIVLLSRQLYRWMLSRWNWRISRFSSLTWVVSMPFWFNRLLLRGGRGVAAPERWAPWGLPPLASIAVLAARVATSLLSVILLCLPRSAASTRSPPRGTVPAETVSPDTSPATNQSEHHSSMNLVRFFGSNNISQPHKIQFRMPCCNIYEPNGKKMSSKIYAMRPDVHSSFW